MTQAPLPNTAIPGFAPVPAQSLQLLDSAVALTADRERSLLGQSLLRTIGELLPLQEVRVLPPQASDTEKAGLSGDHWHCLPRAASERLVAIDVACDGPKQERILGAFLRLYRNFLAIIDESERDGLTQLRNRRALDAELASDSARLRRLRADQDAPEAARRDWLALLDIDHFKRVNDGFGHLYGDEVLVLLAQLLQAHFPPPHAPFRYGGEEFAVLLRSVSETEARDILETCRQQVAAKPFPGVGHITISCGYCEASARLAPPLLLERADRALYAAKGGGRNRVIGFDEPADGDRRRSSRRAEDVTFF